MRESVRLDFALSSASSDSWLRRVRDNFRDMMVRSPFSASTPNGAPIHLLNLHHEHPARSQTASLLTHGAVVVALLVAAHGAARTGYSPNALPIPIPPLYPRLHPNIVDSPSLGHRSGGGADNPTPARRGFFPQSSPVPLATPRLPDQLNHPLPVTVTIFDADAPPVTAAISNLGLPEMKTDTNSGGPGHNGIGGGKNGGMGDDDGPGAGDGDDGRAYAPGLSSPICVYCPIPVYTDEARHVKMQGTVTLRVKVGVDGRAGDIRVLRGVGYGLEERAVASVRGWKFAPARDASGHVVAAWVTIEAVFHLF